MTSLLICNSIIPLEHPFSQPLVFLTCLLLGVKEDPYPEINKGRCREDGNTGGVEHLDIPGVSFGAPGHQNITSTKRKEPPQARIDQQEKLRIRRRKTLTSTETAHKCMCLVYLEKEGGQIKVWWEPQKPDLGENVKNICKDENIIIKKTKVKATEMFPG